MAGLPLYDYDPNDEGVVTEVPPVVLVGGMPRHMRDTNFARTPVPDESLPLPGPRGNADLPTEARDRAGGAGMELTPSPPEPPAEPLPPQAIGGAVRSASTNPAYYPQTESGEPDQTTQEILAQRPLRSITETRPPPPAAPPPSPTSPNEDAVNRALGISPEQVRRIKGSPGGPPTAIGPPGELVDHAPRLEPPPERYRSLEKNDPKLFGQINHVADAMGIARRDLTSLVFASSGYNPEFRDGNHVGLGGVTPEMHKFVDPDGTLNPEDPGDNLFIAAEFYKRMSDFYGPGTAESYAAYRMGDKGLVDALLRRHPDDHQTAAPKGTFDFINRVLGRAGYDAPPETSMGAPTAIPRDDLRPPQAYQFRPPSDDRIGGYGAPPGMTTARRSQPAYPPPTVPTSAAGDVMSRMVGGPGAVEPNPAPNAQPAYRGIVELARNPHQVGALLTEAGRRLLSIDQATATPEATVAALAPVVAQVSSALGPAAQSAVEAIQPAVQATREYAGEVGRGMRGEAPSNTLSSLEAGMGTPSSGLPAAALAGGPLPVPEAVPVVAQNPPVPSAPQVPPAAPAPVQPAATPAAPAAGNAPQPNLVPGRRPPNVTPETQPTPQLPQGMQAGGALRPAPPVPAGATSLDDADIEETGAPPPTTTGSTDPNVIRAVPRPETGGEGGPIPPTSVPPPITAPPPSGRGAPSAIPPANTPPGGPAVGANAPPSPASNAPITSLSGHPTNITPEGMVTAARQGGPNQVLTYLVEHARPGSSVGEAWDQARAATAMYFLAKGDPLGGQHAEAYMFQLQHAGAYQNILAAYRAFGDGNPANGADLVGAAQMLAKSHAFVNDGAMAGLQVIDDKLYFQRFDEQTHKPLGRPVQITADGIRRMLIQTEDPKSAHEMVNKERITNETIRHNNASETETQRSHLSTEGETRTFHRSTEQSRRDTLEKDYASIAATDTRTAANREAANERARLARESADERARQAQLRKDAELRQSLATAAAKEGDEFYGSNATTDPLDIEGKKMDPQTRIKAQDIYNSLRTSGNMQSGRVQDIVKSLVLPQDDPRKKFTTWVVQDANGRPQVSVTDIKGNVITYLPPASVKSWLPITSEPTPAERARGLR